MKCKRVDNRLERDRTPFASGLFVLVFPNVIDGIRETMHVAELQHSCKTVHGFHVKFARRLRKRELGVVWWVAVPRVAEELVKINVGGVVGVDVGGVRSVTRARDGQFGARISHPGSKVDVS